jgi:hypothetical protein
MLTFTPNPVTELVRRMPFADYSARPGISQSFCKQFDPDLGGCPALALHNHLHPHDRKPSSDALEDGTKLHLFVLDPDEFVRRYAVLDAATMDELFAQAVAIKSKAKGFSKSLGTFKTWAEGLAQDGRGYVDTEELAELNRKRDALYANPEVVPYLRGVTLADMEVSMFAGHELSDGKALQLKGRADLLLPDSDVILDLKSCRTAHPREFAAQVGRLGYDLQVSYLDLARANGLDKRRLGFLAQDSFPPYLSTIHWLPEEWMKYARIRYRKILLDIADAIRRNDWPGYQSGVLMPPSWLAGEIEALAA